MHIKILMLQTYSNRFSSVELIKVKLINEKETNVGRDLVLTPVADWMLRCELLKMEVEFRWTK